MNNILIYPIIIPLITALLLTFWHNRIRLQQVLTLISVISVLIISIITVFKVKADGILLLEIGSWQAPFGIVLVGDMLAVILVTVANFVALMCFLYSFNALEEGHKKHYAYPLMLIMLTGVNGSFLTGDIFNLFVFFEVMLIASYVLLTLGGKKRQLTSAITYVVINIVASTLFVVATGYLYAVTGTLNMADLSVRVAEIGQHGLLTAIGFMYLLVFGLKSGLLLFYWLPGSYSAPSPAISAFFAALLTKVGVYTVIRTFTLIFYHRPDITHEVMLWMAVLTMILGALGAVFHWEIKKILGYNVIVSVGFILFGVAIASEQSLSGALFYLMHDMLAKALIFITGGAIISIFGTDKLKEFSGLILFRPLLGWLFFIACLALAGVPPLSGFVGKVMILKGAITANEIVMAVVGLLSSLLVLYSVIKIFIHSFWGETLMSEGQEFTSGKSALLPGTLLVIAIATLGIGAEYVMPFIEQATSVMINPNLYIEAVLPENYMQ